MLYREKGLIFWENFDLGMADFILIIVSILAVGFGIYWYFIHVPNYYGYASNGAKALEKYLNPDRLHKLTVHPKEDIMILDVREEEYFLLGHIPGAHNFPHDLVEKWYKDIPKDKYLILYCDLTLKTQNVIIFLEEKGYDKMLNWGKYNRWKFDEVVEEIVEY